MVKMISDSLPQRGCLCTEIDLALPATLHGDPVRRGQILLTLPFYGGKFTERASISIQVNLAAYERSTRLVRFAVTGYRSASSFEQQAKFLRF